jgi:hypothetical protein
MTQAIRLTDELLEAALRARMQTAPNSALLDRIITAAATTQQDRRGRRLLQRSWAPVRVQLPAFAGVAAAVIALTLLFAALRAPSVGPKLSPSPSPTSAATSRPLPTPELRLMGTSRGLRLRFGGDTAPIDLIDAFGSMWTADIHGPAVSRINPDTLQEIVRIPVAGGPAWFVEAAGALWVTTQNGIGITRIDPATNEPTVSVGDAPPCGRPALRNGEIWVAACDADAFLRIDPVSATVIATIPAKGHGWVLLAGSRLVTLGPEGLAELNPSSGSFARIGAGAGVGGTLLAADAGSIWVGFDDRVERIGASDGAVLATLEYRGAQSMSIAGDHAWLTVDNTGVLEIDLATNAVTKTVPLLPSPLVPREAFGALWVTDFNNSDLWRIQP